ncbi:hypothetical protein D3C80_1372380 [compost metagenome]
MAAQTGPEIRIGTCCRALRIEAFPQLFHIQVNQRQDAQQHKGDEGKQPNTWLQEGVILHFNGRHPDAHQIDIQHHPLFKLLKHQQDRAQIHA